MGGWEMVCMERLSSLLNSDLVERETLKGRALKLI